MYFFSKCKAYILTKEMFNLEDRSHFHTVKKQIDEWVERK